MRQHKQLINGFFIPLIVGVCISGLLALQLSRINSQTIDDAISQEALRLTNQVIERLNRYEYGLRGARGAILTAGDTSNSRKLFERYSQTRDIDTEFPGAHGFGFIRRVPKEQEADFIAKARLDGKPDFSIRQLAPHDGDRYIIQYIEPTNKNSAAIGLDVASENYRREAAQASMRNGTVTITGPITLVQAMGKPSQSFLIFLPIYKSTTIPATIAEREAQLVGWSYAPLLMGEVLKNLVDETIAELTLRDITQSSEGEVFYVSKKLSVKPTSSHILERDLLGRRWQIEFSSSPIFIHNLHLIGWPTAFLIGLAFSFLMALVIWFLHLNNYRKKSILDAQARVAAIVEHSIDGVIGKTLEGVVTSWNKGAEAIFGYSAREAVGKSIADLIVTQELLDEEAQLLTRINNGESIPHFVTTRHRKDGSIVTVSVAVAPIRNTSGEIIGASKTVRDISEQQALQDQIVALNVNLEAQVIQRTAQLERAHRNLQAILDAVPSIIGYWDKNLINQVANRAYHDWFGLEYGTIPGLHFSQLLDEHYLASNRPFMDAVMAGERQTFTGTIPAITGEKHTLGHYLPDINNGEVQGFYVIIHDITEITEATQKLQNAIRENQAIFNTINEQMLYSVTDIRGNIIDANENFCSASGYSREEIIGKNHRLLNSGEHSDEFWHDMWCNITEGKPWHGEVWNRAKNGGLCCFDTVIAPFTDEQGAAERYVALRTDITERKEAERERNRLNLFIASVLNAATEISIIATDNDGLITVFNRGAERMLGYKADEVIGKTTLSPMHLMEEVIARGQELSLEYGQTIEGFRVFVHKSEIDGSETRNWTYVRKDDSHLQVSLIVTTMRDKQGFITGYLGVASDITTELNNKKQIQSTINQLDIAAKVAELGIWTWDIHDNSLHWSDRMFEMYDQPKHLNNNGLNYQHWYERVHPEDVNATADALMAAVEGRGTYDPIFRIVTRSGKIRFMHAAAQIERDSSGNATKVTGINRDITNQKELETNLLKAKEAADAANESKSAFLANMSHEIRTPMNAVLGMLQLLQYTELTEHQQDYLSKSQTAAKSLLGLLNDILDFSKIDAGKLQLDKHPFELEPLMRDLAVILSANQKEKQIEVIFDIDAALPKTLTTDRLRLQQILINLAGNALKFTHQGQVIVTLKLVQKDAQKPLLQIAVSDSGIGISPEQTSRIFEGFVQAEASITRRYGGTGLGLVITKRLVDLMGGELKLDSVLGIGSRFWFEIPLATDELETAPLITTQQQFKKLHALVVDDNAFSRLVLIQALQSMGIQTNEARNGTEALEKIHSADQQNTAYDIVLMDWQMPGLDGLLVAESIQHSITNKAPPIIIMITAYGHEEIFIRQTSESAPYKELLTKPVTPHQISEAITRAITGVVHTTPAITRQQPLAGIRLLVVEDNAFNRQVASELLVGEGATVELAEGGMEGIAKVLDDQQVFDLVIMDVQMPDIDGLEATRRIRANAHFKNLPILAMTANVSSDDKKACLQAGMNDHVGKPFDMDEVISRVLTLVNKPSSQTTNNNAQSSNKNNQDTIQQWPLLDAPTLILNRFGKKKSLFATLHARFYSDMATLLDTLKTQTQQNNPEAVGAALHSIKGIASTMGAKVLANKAAKLEIYLTSPDISLEAKVIDTAALDELTQLLEQSNQQLQELLDSL